MTKSVMREYNNLTTRDDVMRWLAERGIVPVRIEQEKTVQFRPRIPKTAAENFRNLLGLQSRDDVSKVRDTLKQRADWKTLPYGRHQR